MHTAENIATLCSLAVSTVLICKSCLSSGATDWLRFLTDCQLGHQCRENPKTLANLRNQCHSPMVLPDVKSRRQGGISRRKSPQNRPIVNCHHRQIDEHGSLDARELFDSRKFKPAEPTGESTHLNSTRAEPLGTIH